MRVLSLFDGISCGMVALKRAGIKVDSYDAYEIDKYAIKISESNYPEIRQHGDVFKADFTQYGGMCDLLIGGSPCTYWSINKREGRETTSSGMGWDLFCQYVRALREAQPRYFLYENNFSMSPDIKAAITRELGVEPIMINSNLVSAQNRRRYYWTNIPDVTQPFDKGIYLRDILEEPNAYAVSARLKGTTWGHEIVKSNTLLARDYKGFGNQNMTAKIIDGKIHRLSVKEYERLQTLPDGYTKSVSNSQAYKAIGNGWTVDVIVHILSNIKNYE